MDAKNVSIPRTRQHFLNLKVSKNCTSYGFDLVKKTEIKNVDIEEL